MSLWHELRSIAAERGNRHEAYGGTHIAMASVLILIAPRLYHSSSLLLVLTAQPQARLVLCVEISPIYAICSSKTRGIAQQTSTATIRLAMESIKWHTENTVTDFYMTLVVANCILQKAREVAGSTNSLSTLYSHSPAIRKGNTEVWISAICYERALVRAAFRKCYKRVILHYIVLGTTGSKQHKRSKNLKFSHIILQCKILKCTAGQFICHILAIQNSWILEAISLHSHNSIFTAFGICSRFSLQANLLADT